MYEFYSSAALGVYLRSLQVIFKHKTNGQFGKGAVKIVVKQDSFSSTAN